MIQAILSVGAGTRLWPVPREAHPKAFIVLPDRQSLMQKTLRHAAVLKPDPILTIANRVYFFATGNAYAEVALALGIYLNLETVVDGEVTTKVARISTTYSSWFVHPKSTAPQLSSLPGKPRQIWLFACPDISQLRFLGLCVFS